MLTLSTLDDEIASHRIYTDDARCREVFRQLRAEDPVHLTKASGHPPFWAVTKYNDVIEIERLNDKFINAPMAFLRGDEEERILRLETNGTGVRLRNLIYMDAAEHKAYRGLTQAWFMPQNLKRLSPVISQRARESMDMMASKGTTCDIAVDIAPWFPLRVIMGLLGVPDQDHVLMLRLTQALVAPRDAKQRKGDGNSITSVINEFFDYFRILLGQRKSDPRDDLLTLIANAKVDGEPIEELEKLSYCLTLATAGHDTTASALTVGLLGLIQNPDQLRKLQNQPALLPSAVEEVLRWSTPVKHFMRTATEDYVLRDRKIKSGDLVMLSYPSANMDEEIFTDPELFLVDRNPNKQIAFGFGVHACLGQHLSRMELRSFFSNFLERVTDIRLTGVTEMVESNKITGLRVMPVEYKMIREGRFDERTVS